MLLISVRFDCSEQPDVAHLLPRAGPTDGGTLVLLTGTGFTRYTSPYERASRRFGAAASSRRLQPPPPARGCHG